MIPAGFRSISYRITGALFGFILLPLVVSGCGNDPEVGEADNAGTRDRSGAPPEISVVFCPRGGGQLKFLKTGTLEIVESELEIPVETIYLGSAPSPRFFIALTNEALFLIPTIPGHEVRSVTLPAISDDIRIARTDKGMILLDRQARRLIGIDLRNGSIEFDRSLSQSAEEIYYVPDQDKIVLVMKKGTSGVLSVLSPEGGESMTINLDEIICSTVVGNKGRIYLATRGFEGDTRLEAFRVDDLSRILDVDLREIPGHLLHPPGSDKIYAYYPGSGLVRGIDFGSGEFVSEIPLEDRGKATLSTDEIGRYLYLLQKESGNLTIISTETDLVAGVIEKVGGDTRLLSTPESHYILLQDKGGMRVRLYDGEDLDLLRVFMERDPVTIGLIRSVEGDSIEEKRELVEGESDLPVTGEVPVSQLYELQIFASNELSSSNRVVDDLRSLGIPTNIEEAVIETGETWFRVKVGSFSEREDAERVGDYLNNIRRFEVWIKSVDKDHMIARRSGIEETLQNQDLDTDGYPEIAVVGRGGSVQIFSYRSNRFVPRWKSLLPGDQSLCGEIRYPDVSEGGVPEVLLPLCPLGRDYRITWDDAQFRGGYGS